MKKTLQLTLLGFAVLFCMPLQAELISVWSADGDSNDPISAYNGALSNGATYAAGKWSQAFSLDGVNDAITFPNGASLNRPSTTNAITVCAWIKWSGNTNVNSTLPIARKCTSTNTNPYRVWDLVLTNTGQLSFAISNGMTNQAGVATSAAHVVVAGQWYHVAGTYDGETVKAYVDGVLVATRASTYSIASSTGPFYIGRDVGSCFYGGLIDQVELYSHALTESEVRARRDFNLPPVANAGVDQVVYVGSGTECSVTLDGSASTDPEDDTLAFVWGGAITGTTASVTQTLPVGIHMANLTVTDQYNQSSFATVHVAVVQGSSLSTTRQMQTLIDELVAQAAEDQQTITTLAQRNTLLIGSMQSLVAGLEQIQAAATTIHSTAAQQKQMINTVIGDN